LLQQGRQVASSQDGIEIRLAQLLGAELFSCHLGGRCRHQLQQTLGADRRGHGWREARFLASDRQEQIQVDLLLLGGLLELGPQWLWMLAVMQQKAGLAVGIHQSQAGFPEPTETAPVVIHAHQEPPLHQELLWGWIARGVAALPGFQGFPVPAEAPKLIDQGIAAVECCPGLAAIRLHAIRFKLADGFHARQLRELCSLKPCTGSPGVVTGWLRGHQCLPDLLGVVVVAAF